MSVQPTSQLEEKTAFFNNLASILVESDEDDDPGRKASENALQVIPKSSIIQSQLAVDDDARPAPNVGQVHTKTNASKTITNSSVADIATERSVSKRNPSLPNILERAKPGKSTGKRKREAVISATAQNQLFSGLRFFFFPNNDVHPARRMRIAKAIEHGAVWEKQWSEAVTHVILDKMIDFSQLLKYLRLAELPAHIVAVLENYPAECIAYRAIVQPKQPKFAVRGQKATTAVSTPAQVPDLIALDKSLPLKPAGKATREQVTPSQQSDEAGELVTLIADVPVDDEHDLECVADSFSAPSVESNMDLAEAIREAKAMSDLPLDRDRDADFPPSGSDILDSNAGSLDLKTKTSKFQHIQDKFQCMQKHTGDQPKDCPNSSTIDILQQMADYYEQTGNAWRLRAYRKAITTLREHPVKVRTKEEAQILPNVGERLAIKIEEIAFTNRLRRLDNAIAEPTDQILKVFMNIYGVGYETASKWVRLGFKTLDDLLEKADLTANQKIGIQRYDDFLQRIPRAEVEEHGALVRQELQKIDPAFEVIIGGSYRRGAQDSGDIDCIITRPNTSANHIHMVVTEQLMPTLFKKGFLQAGLAVTSRDDGSKWHGASCLPGLNVWRRIDFLYVPSDEIGAALIYFTGNDIFNRSLRLLASKKGLRLNQRGLYKDVVRGPGRVKLTEGILVEGRDEKKIFEILGVPWRPPEHRIC